MDTRTDSRDGKTVTRSARQYVLTYRWILDQMLDDPTWDERQCLLTAAEAILVCAKAHWDTQAEFIRDVGIEKYDRDRIAVLMAPR